MDYQMMVKEAYENIMGEIEKEALDYSVGKSTAYLPGAAQNAIMSTAKDPDRYSRVMDAVNKGVKRIDTKLDTARESARRYGNALESLKLRGVQDSAPAYRKVNSGFVSANKDIDKLRGQYDSLRSFKSRVNQIKQGQKLGY